MKDDLKMTRVAYDVATLYTILPWIFMYGDKRNPQLLAKAALTQVKEFIETTDHTKDRKALMRGLMINFMQRIGSSIDPNVIESVTATVASQVDEVITALYDDNLSGEEA